MIERVFRTQLKNLQSLDLHPVKVVMSPEAYRSLRPLMQPPKKGKTGWGYLDGIKVGLSVDTEQPFVFYNAACEELNPLWN